MAAKTFHASVAMAKAGEYGARLIMGDGENTQQALVDLQRQVSSAFKEGYEFIEGKRVAREFTVDCEN